MGRWTLIAGWLALATVARAAPEPDAARWTQEVAPSLEARQRTAQARITARETWFDGQGSWSEAFPHLDPATLDSEPVLVGRLAALDDREADRVAEGIASIPLDGRARDAARAQLTATHALETTADALERRALVGLRGLLRARPELGRARLGPWRDALLARMAPIDGLEPDAAAAHARDAAVAADELRLLEQTLAAVRRAALVPDAPVVVDLAEIARLDDADREEEAARRLILALPAIAPDATDALVDRLLVEEGERRARSEARRDEARAALDAIERAPRLSPDDAAAAVRDAESELAAVRVSLAALPEDALGRARRERHAIDEAAAIDRLAAANQRLERARRHAAGSSVEESAAEAEQARAEADAATATATEASGRRLAELLAGNAEAQQRRSNAQESAERARATRDETATERDAALDGFDAQAREVLTLSTLDPARPDPDALYLAVRAMLNRLREGPVATGLEVEAARAARAVARERVDADRDQLAAFEAELDALTAARTGEGTPPADVIGRWREALAEEERLADAGLFAAQADRDGVLRAMQRCRELRQQLRPYTSVRLRESDRTFFIADIVQELRLLPPMALALARDRWVALVGLPMMMLDYNVVRGLASSSFWTLLFGAVWLWARSRAMPWADVALVQIRRVGLELTAEDDALLRDPTARAIRAFIDLGLGWSLVGPLGALLPEIGFLILVYLQVALVRFGLALFDLAAVRQPDLRPGLLALKPDAHALARTTVRLALLWWVARGFFGYLLWDVLGLDTTAALARWLFTLAGLTLSVALLHLWEPHLRERIANRRQESRWVALLSLPHGGELLRAPRALAMFLFFTLSRAVDLWYWLIQRDRTGLGRVLLAITRLRTTTRDEATHEPLPEDVSRRLCSDTHPDDVIQRDAPDRIASAYRAWTTEKRRGMVALVGDRGEGKSLVIQAFIDQSDDGGHPLCRGELTRRLLTPDEVVTWVARLVGVSDVTSPEDLIARLGELEPRRIVVERAHFSFIRRVGGFIALETLLQVVSATSARHFWVLVFHEVAWRYLGALRALLDMSIFRAVVLLEPLPPDALRQLTVRHATRLGFELDFSRLVRANPFGSDPEVELERAVLTFYRLLADVGSGNPWISTRLFASCCELGADDRLYVYNAPVLNGDVISDLLDAPLFVLAAVRVHEVLYVEGVESVTNLGIGTTRSAVRDLIARGLLQDVGDGALRIPTPELPRVTRTLRRRQMIHL